MKLLLLVLASTLLAVHVLGVPVEPSVLLQYPHLSKPTQLSLGLESSLRV